LEGAGRDQEEVRKLSVELRYFEQTAETLQERLGMMNAAVSDLTYANATLEAMEKEKTPAEVLMPIGGGNFVKAKLTGADKIIVGMGAGVSIEKTLTEAKEIVKERIEQIESTRVQAQQQLSQIVDRINKGRTRMETLLAGMQEGKQ